MTNFKTFINNRKGQILQSLLIAFILPFILFVSIPMEVFGNNLAEFNFSLSDFMPVSILLAFLFLLVIFAVLFVLPKRANRIVCFCLLAIEIMFFLQGTYLNAGAGYLGGDNMGESISTLSIVFNALVWVVIISAIIVLGCLNDKKGYIKTGSMIVIAILIMTQVVSLITISTKQGIFASKTDRMLAIDENYVEKSLTTKDIGTMSNTNNIYYFVVDRFDEVFAKDAYERKPEIFNALDGFTWFQDYISLYGHTFPGIASMLTEKQLDLETENRIEFFKRAYSGENPLTELKNNGYEINLYTQSYYAYNGSELPEFVNNFNEGKFQIKNSFALAFKMTYIAISRCVPLIFKNLVGQDMNSNTCNKECGFVSNDGDMGYSADNKDVYDTIKDLAFTTKNKKMFSFIHFEGCHNIDYDADFNKLNGFAKKGMIYSVENSFKIIQKFIDNLKTNSMYENSTIIITGDHSSPYNDYEDISQPRQTALFVKPKNSANTDLQISQTQVCQNDIWPTIFKENAITSSIVSGTSVFDVLLGENRTRDFVWHTFEGTRTQQFTYQIIGAGNDLNNYILKDTKVFNHFIMD